MVRIKRIDRLGCEKASFFRSASFGSQAGFRKLLFRDLGIKELRHKMNLGIGGLKDCGIQRLD
jgi:hypothetical protein